MRRKYRRKGIFLQHYSRESLPDFWTPSGAIIPRVTVKSYCLVTPVEGVVVYGLCAEISTVLSEEILEPTSVKHVRTLSFIADSQAAAYRA
jgi:hypothetical protein